ncbi:hypothetical protein Pcinc_024502 [Petrolisthes cinctipes]|uniref:Uncharacterized protein n=1 Tax=Petrolisthes cinctipes TaxID=88211 RepID=A0AAE1FAF7_PETCI|nr:hypothetical protein Pcinc_024502 [Petrolisthes cinctipes]
MDGSRGVRSVGGGGQEVREGIARRKRRWWRGVGEEESRESGEGGGGQGKKKDMGKGGAQDDEERREGREGTGKVCGKGASEFRQGHGIGRGWREGKGQMVLQIYLGNGRVGGL